MKISMVIPCYNSSQTISGVVKQVEDIYSRMNADYEVILVNDCSRDSTWDVICELAARDDKIKGLNLAKNSGQHAAAMAGFRLSDGDYVMACDDDGQTPVEHIPDMVRLLEEEDLDAVCAKYVQREKRSLTRVMGSKLYQSLVFWLIDAPAGIMPTIFMVTRRFVIDEICRFNQPYPMFGPLLLRTTNRVKNIELEQHERVAGKSGYTLRKLIHTFLNGFVAFSIKPLRFSVAVGVISSVLGFIFGAYVIVRKVIDPLVASGWSSIVSILMIMSGLVLIVLGMIGEYLGRMYMTIALTPQYVVRDTVNVKRERR
ncbi:MAG: glycosyltransferase [Lachnospiraceae bacterium]|nr:glycosyltransferase [Lachnospiraceae bacterium]